MKSSSKNFQRLPLAVACCFALLGGLVFSMNSGCQTSTPGFGAYPAPTSVPNSNRVDQFNARTSVLNPNLFENSNPPNYTLKTAGSVTLINNFSTYGSLTT